MNYSQIQLTDRKMSSREISVITEKRHADVLNAIRKMETAWEKINERKFSLVEYTDTKGERRPEYVLDKYECLFIATKFNDEARAILIKRWAELEAHTAEPQSQIPQTFAEALKLAYEQQITIERLETRTKFVDVVFNSDDLLTGAQVCKLLNLSYGNKTLYKNLREKGLFFKNRNEPKQLFVDKGYFRMKEVLIKDKVRIQTYFTQKGLGYIAKFLGVIIQPINTVRMID